MAGDFPVISGMKAICDYCGQIGLPRTEASVLQLWRDYSFPMKKILGIWVADKDAIVEWYRKQATSNETSDPAPAAQPPVTKQRRKQEKCSEK